jgi:hypothetical protein
MCLFFKQLRRGFSPDDVQDWIIREVHVRRR